MYSLRRGDTISVTIPRAHVGSTAEHGGGRARSALGLEHRGIVFGEAIDRFLDARGLGLAGVVVVDDPRAINQPGDQFRVVEGGRGRLDHPNQPNLADLGAGGIPFGLDRPASLFRFRLLGLEPVKLGKLGLLLSLLVLLEVLAELAVGLSLPVRLGEGLGDPGVLGLGVRQGSCQGRCVRRRLGLRGIVVLVLVVVRCVLVRVRVRVAVGRHRGRPPKSRVQVSPQPSPSRRAVSGQK